MNVASLSLPIFGLLLKHGAEGGFFLVVHFRTRGLAVVVVLLVATAHFLAVDHLLVEFTAEEAQTNVQAKKELSHGRKVLVIGFEECFGDLFTGEHF